MKKSESITRLRGVDSTRSTFQRHSCAGFRPTRAHPCPRTHRTLLSALPLLAHHGIAPESRRDVGSFRPWDRWRAPLPPVSALYVRCAPLRCKCSAWLKASRASSRGGGLKRRPLSGASDQRHRALPDVTAAGALDRRYHGRRGHWPCHEPSRRGWRRAAASGRCWRGRGTRHGRNSRRSAPDG